jgi:hypothetical protein
VEKNESSRPDVINFPKKFKIHKTGMQFVLGLEGDWNVGMPQSSNNGLRASDWIPGIPTRYQSM